MDSLLAAQQSNAFAWLVTAFAAGIALYFALWDEPPFGVTGLLVFITACPVLYLWRRRDRRMPQFAAATLIFCLSAGFLTAQIRAQIVHTPMILKKAGPVTVEGTIERIDIMGDGGDMRVVLGDVSIEDVAAGDTPKKIRLRLKKGGEMMPGQRVRGLASLNPPSPPVAPGAFDFQRQAYFESIGAVGFFFRAPEIIAQPQQAGIIRTIEEWRLSIAARVSQRFAQPQAGLITALMTGQQRAIAEEDYQAMRDSGLAHLLAISGMNVGMIAISLFFISRLAMAAVPWFALRYPIKKIAAVIAFAGALFYTLIAGMSVPTQRAILMTGIALLAILLDRSPFSLRLFAFAALAIMLTTPENLMGVSFQMSFAAVMALIVFYDWARPFWTAAYARAGMIRRGLLYMAGVLVTTIIGGTVTGIFSLYHFQTYALYNVFANMLAVPLTGIVIMPCAVAAMALMPLGLEGLALEGMAWGVTWLLAIARWVAGLDGAVVHIAAYSPMIFCGLVASFIFFMLWQGRARWIAAGFFMICLMLIPFSRTPDVLINEDASLIAVKNDEGQLVFSSGRADSYAAETWLRRNGELPDQKRKVWIKEGRQGDLTCDTAACRYIKDGQKISFLKSEMSRDEECNWANILIADFPAKTQVCAASYIIDRYSVWRSGAHALYIGEDYSRLKTVEGARGVRPWTQKPARD